MGLEDLKKSFDGAITAAANAASDATSIAKKSIQSIDISDAKKVQEKAAAALQSAKNTASDFAENAGAAVSDLVARTTSDENERINGIALQDDRISKIGATRILYYLMAADGDVKPEELEKFDLIGNALLQNYAQIRDSLLQQCEDATSKINENDSRTDAINDLVDKEIETAESSDDDLMDPWPAMPPHLSGLGETGSPNSKTAHSRFPISSARLAGSRHPAGRIRKLPLSWPKSRSVKKSYSKAFATSSLSKEDTMPLPVFFIGAAVATGGAGVVKSVKAGIDARTATKMNEDANALVESTTARLNAHRESCGTALSNLGEEKVFVLENSMKTFLDTFTKLKNVDFKETEGLSELSKMRIDEKEFDELKSMVNFAASLTGGAVAGTAGGALVAFGAYGAAQALACASTGTAIASLSGAAATNATLAFFGGGSIAAGGLGMAGGTAVLGGLVAGPALLVLGLVAGRTADKELDKARTNRAEAMQIASQLETAILQCEAIRGRTYLFYNLIARLDARFLPLVFEMEDNFSKQGDDFSSYDDEAKRIVASCAGVAVAIKTVLDTPMLTDDGLLTDESEATATNVTRVLHEKGIAL